MVGCGFGYEGRNVMNLRSTSLLLLIIFLLATVIGNGSEPRSSMKIETVRDFQDICKTIDNDQQSVTETFKSGYCAGWVTGVVEGVRLAEAQHQVPKGAQIVCGPEGDSLNQTVEIIRKYASEHPEKQHIPMTMIATQALSGACTDQKQAKR
jgi:hypothetical protein